jgi:hypothetical protein
MHQQHRLFLCVPGVQYNLGSRYPPRTAPHSSAFGCASSSETVGWHCLGFGRSVRPSPAPLLLSSRKMVADMSRLPCSACIVAIIRFQTLLPSTTSTDPTWDKLPSALYGIIEPNIGIACACIVTLTPFFKKVRQIWASSSNLTTWSQVETQRRNFSPRIFRRGDTTLPSLGSTRPSNDGHGVKPGEAEKVPDAAASPTS